MVAIIMTPGERSISIIFLSSVFIQTCVGIQLYETFRNLKLTPDLFPHPPTKLCNVTYVSKTGDTLVLRPGQRIPAEYRQIHPNVTWPVRWNKTFCLYMAGISRRQVKMDRRNILLKENTTNYPSGTIFYPLRYEWHNWVVVNIPNNNVSAGQTLYGHLPISNPPEPDAIDRYAFFVFEQVYGIQNYTPPIDGRAYKFRELSGMIHFAEEYALGNPIFGNCFINKWVPDTTTTEVPRLETNQSNTSAEALKLLRSRNVDNPTLNEKQLAKEFMEVKEKYIKMHREIEDTQVDKVFQDTLEPIASTVVSRGLLDTFFSNVVKKYIPVGKSGHRYTGNQIRLAYEKFLQDSTNEVAKTVRDVFKGKQDLPNRMRKLYGKLSFADHNTYNDLNKEMNEEKLKELIRHSPAILNPDEIALVVNLLNILLNRFPR